MASSRLRDDVSAYRRALRQSVDPLSYQLNSDKYVHAKRCRPVLGIMGGNNVSTIEGVALVDAESDLFNITRPASLDPRKGHVPNKDVDILAKKKHLNECQFQQFKRMPGAIWDPPADGSVASQWRTHTMPDVTAMP